MVGSKSADFFFFFSTLPVGTAGVAGEGQEVVEEAGFLTRKDFVRRNERRRDRRRKERKMLAAALPLLTGVVAVAMGPLATGVVTAVGRL